jgi:hypothetical protein
VLVGKTWDKETQAKGQKWGNNLFHTFSPENFAKLNSAPWFVLLFEPIAKPEMVATKT